MSSTVNQPTFAFQHHSWSAVRAHPLGDRATCRRLRGGASETLMIELAVGGAVAARGVPTECTLTIFEGRLTCRIFGNEIELPTGNYAIVPPNVAFTLRAAGRSPAVGVLFAAARLADALPLEAC